MHTIVLTLGLVLLILTIALGVLLWNERRFQRDRLLLERQRALGLPEGELVYEDADGQGEPLSSSAYPAALGAGHTLALAGPPLGWLATATAQAAQAT